MLPLLVRIMVQLQLLLLLLLMLPLSTRITLSLLFSVSVSPSLGRSTMPIWWLSFLLVRPLSRVLLCTLLNPLPIQLHFLCHGGSRCIRIPRDSANVLTICERRTHMDSLASLHSCLWFCYGSPVAWTKARARARTRAASPSTQGCHVDHEHIDIMLHLMTFSDAKKSGSGRHYVAPHRQFRDLFCPIVERSNIHRRIYSCQILFYVW